MQPAPGRRVSWGGRALLVAIAACSGMALVGATEPGLLVGRVARVYDGDSLSLQQGRHRVMVRLAAIDAPELSQPHGRAARDALQACAFGRLVTVRVGSTDRHGRAVGVIDSGGSDCGLLQLQAGLAWHALAYASEQRHAERLAYAAAESEARRRRVGLWGDAAPQAPWDYRRHAPARTAAAH